MRPLVYLFALLVLLGGCSWLSKPSQWFSSASKGATSKAASTGAKPDDALSAQELELKNHDLADQLKKVQAEKEQAENELARLQEDRSLGGGSGGTHRAAGQGRGVVRAVSLRGRTALRRLADECELLEFDDELTACRLTQRLEFEPDRLEFSPRSQWVLNDLVKILQQDNAVDFRVLVVSRGSGGGPGVQPPAQVQATTDRAGIVAHYLSAEGIAADRIGLLALGSDATVRGSGVEVYVLGGDVMTVGWEDAQRTRR